MRKLAVIVCGAAAVAALTFPRTGASAPPVAPSIKAVAPITVKPAAAIALQAAPALRSFTDLGGQMLGAGPNVVAIIGEDGKIAKSFATKIARPSISPHGPNAIVIGDLDARTIATMDVKTGAITPLLKLAEVTDPASNAPDKVPGAHILKGGAFSSAASDGKFLYVGVEAGFSSSIFKIDPTTKQVVGRAWASGPDPDAMTVHKGSLFVLVAGNQVRRFTNALERSRENIDLPVTNAKGLGIRTGEIRVLDSTQGRVVRATVDAAELEQPSISKNLDRMVVAPAKARLTLQPKGPNEAKKYAVLITGDRAENFWGECFWNDTVWMYKTLLSKGYQPENIFVLYGDGDDYASANPKFRHPAVVTDFAATPSNVTMLLDGLKNGDSAHNIPKMDSNDALFLWTFDHGGQSGGESTLCLRGGSMKASVLSEKLNALAYESRAIFMQQCYSGGFINLLKNAKTFISTASKANETSHPADTENETYNGMPYSYGEFDFHIITAIGMAAVPSTPIAPFPNANNDGVITTLEMHNWNALKESRSETPQMNDMGGIGSTFRFAK